jgi:hypothetical protein
MQTNRKCGLTFEMGTVYNIDATATNCKGFWRGNYCHVCMLSAADIKDICANIMLMLTPQQITH